MNTFMTYEPEATLRPEPGQRTMTAKDFRKRLMDISALIKDTRECKHHTSSWPSSPTKVWMVSALDNRIIDLMEQATSTAKALASAPVEVIVEHPDV